MTVYQRHTLSNGLRVLTAPLDHAQVGRLLHHARRRLALRGRIEPRHRALRRAHVLQGNRAAADGARPRDGGRPDRRRVQRLHLEGVHRLLHPLRRRAARPGARRARRHDPQLEVRQRRARAREGRDHRGDEHVLRHAARLRRLGVRGAPLRLNPLGWETLGTKETITARRARRSSTTSATGTRRRAWSSASPGRSATTCSPTLEGLLGDMPGTAPARPCPPTLDAADGAAGAHPPEGLRPGERLPRRSVVPARPSRPLRVAAARHRARHRHVVAALPRGARAPRPRLLRLRRSTARTPTPARSSRRRAST